MHFCFTTCEITKYVLWKTWIFAHVIFRVYLGYPGLVLGRNEVKPYLNSVHHLCRFVPALHSLSSCSPPINFIFNPETKKKCLSLFLWQSHIFHIKPLWSVWVVLPLFVWATSLFGCISLQGTVSNTIHIPLFFTAS